MLQSSVKDTFLSVIASEAKQSICFENVVLSRKPSGLLAVNIAFRSATRQVAMRNP